MNESTPQSRSKSQHLNLYGRVNNLTIQMNESTPQYIYLRVSTSICIDELTPQQYTCTNRQHNPYHRVTNSNNSVLQRAQCAVVYCSVLQCVAVCCSVLKSDQLNLDAAYSHLLLCLDARCWCVLCCTDVFCCSHTNIHRTCCNTLQHSCKHMWDMPQHTETHLQHTNIYEACKRAKGWCIATNIYGTRCNTL